MAMTARSAVCFALPATQNTAPVHEFRCLYTHDVRKKAKKWHDGSAKFHTFNKRVMVYDDTKNYIGDLHYQDDEEFGEGIELQLDRGVLVEVGERLGETQTDLTGIIYKSAAKGNPSAASANGRAVPVQRINHMNSQGRPKSLMELLGTSQGRHGRATLPTQSPFGQRQALRDTQQIEPPAKRQKCAYGKENGNPADGGQEQDHNAISSVSSYAVSRPLSKALPKKRQDMAASVDTRQVLDRGEVGDIPSDEDDIVAAQKTRKSTAPNPRRSEQSIATSITRPYTPATKSRKQNSQAKAQCFPTEQEPTSRSTSSDATFPKPHKAKQAGHGDKSMPVSGIVMSSLKMVSQKPRRKLLYKALLPSSNTAIDSVDLDSSVEPQAVIPHGSLPEEEGLPESTLQFLDPHDAVVASEFEESSGGISASPPKLNATNTSPGPSLPVPELESEPEPESASLFVSQPGFQQSPTPQKTLEEDDMVIATPHIAQQHDNTEPFSPEKDSATQEHDDNINPEPESPCFPQPRCASRPFGMNAPAESPPSETTAVSAVLPYPQPPNEKRSPQESQPPFAKSLSDSDSPPPRDPRTTACMPDSPFADLPLQDFSRQPTMLLHRSPLLQRRVPHNPSPTKSPLSRSHSDITAIVPTTIAPTQNIISDEQGPWTSLEAFLLFDKWPDCKMKNKPNFEALSDSQEEELEIDDDGIDLAPAPNIQPVMIRSARAVWQESR